MKIAIARAASAIALIAALAAPLSAQAHRGWLLPSSTVLSGDEAWVGFDAGASNQVFVADHNALRMDNLVVMAPDRSTITPQHMMQGRYRSTFDVHLTQAGTYKIVNASAGMSASYMLDGEQKRWRGTAAEFTSALPADATEVVASNIANRMEAFVTLGAPTETVFTPTGQGLEMMPITHPNDAVVGEASSFKLMKNGQPAANMEITVARSGARYRDNPEDVTLTTDAEGQFSITWPEPGMYWINATTRTEAEGETLASSAQYTGIVEVLL